MTTRTTRTSRCPFPARRPACRTATPPACTDGTSRSTLRGQSRQIVLHVGGAESVHAVFVNGSFAGYGTDSRLPSEYDVTDFVQPGENDSGDRGDPIQRPQLRRGPGPMVDGGAAPQRVRRGTPPRPHRWPRGPRRLGSGRRHGVAVGSNHGLLRARDATVRRLSDPNVARQRRGSTNRSRRSSSRFPHEHFAPYVFVGHHAMATWSEVAVRPWSAETPELYRVHVAAGRPGRGGGRPPRHSESDFVGSKFATASCS